MQTKERWFSTHGFIIEITPAIQTVAGKFFLPSNLTSNSFDLSGIVTKTEEAYNLAFIINWKMKRSNSYTAFNGKINDKGNLLLNWLLSSEDLNSNKRINSLGSSTLTRNYSELKTNQLDSLPMPFPTELRNISAPPPELSQDSKLPLFQ